MKRNLFITTFICSTLLLISSNFAYASSGECDACNTTSPYVDNYINFANELIKTFQTYANQDTYTFQQQGQKNITNGGDQINSNMNGQFVRTDANRQLQSIVDNLNQKAQATASTVYVFGLVTTETAFLDSWKSISPMVNGKAILRDRDKIDKVGQSVTNTLLDLGNNGVFERLGFRQGRNERIEEILKRYSNMNNPPITYTLGDKKLASQPRDILGALRRMNQALKTTIGIGSNDIIDNSNNKFLNGVITFSPGAQEELVNYYKCARGTAGIACSKAGSRAKDNLEKTRKETTKETNDAKKIITNSLKRLSGFWSNNGGAKEMLKQRTNELLRAEYGWQGVRNNQGDTIGQGLKNGLNNAFGFKETRTALKNDTQAIGPFAGLKEVNKKQEGEPFRVGDLATKQIIKNDEDVLRGTFNSITKTARNNWKESTYADVSSVTKLFPMITAEIVSAKGKIDDNKNKESLVENLGKACDLQCRNLGGKCRYQ